MRAVYSGTRPPARRMLVTITQLLHEALRKHRIVPDVADDFASRGLLTVEYPHGNVAMGNTLKVQHTQEPPKVQFTLDQASAQPSDRFTLVLTDPDAPSNADPKWLEFCHWIVADIRLNNPDKDLLTLLDLERAKTIVSHVGPAPPEGTGKHRYVFLLYKQDPTAPAPKDRPNWGTGRRLGVREWSREHGGDLWAANFFYAQHE